MRASVTIRVSSHDTRRLPRYPLDDDAQTRALNYRDAGVDIDAGEALVQRIKPHVARTARAGLLGGIGGFGGLFELPVERYRRPVMVSGADGVGTKLRLAIELDRHDTIGIDLVAMCANDILVSGAEPLWFLDYYASASLDVEVASAVIAGIAEGCVRSGMALLGGETAEMPGLYAAGDYDLAGFAVGVVEKEAIVDGGRVAEGDVLIGLSSSGAHSNGYSLIRKILERLPEGVLHRPFVELVAQLPGERGGRAGTRADPLPGGTLGEVLLAPTRLYVKSVLAVLDDPALGPAVHAMAHITGGGLTENLPRVLPEGLGTELDEQALRRPALFDWLAHYGGVSAAEMRRTFNNGIGFVLVVAEDRVEALLETFQALGEPARPIGRVVANGS